MGGGGTTETTTVSDPWATMPDWMKESYQSDNEYRQGILDRGQGVADELAENPREILGPSDNEYAGMDKILESGDIAGGLGDNASSWLGRDYNSEYTDDVVDTTLEGMDRQHQRDILRREGRGAAVGGTSNNRVSVGNAVAGGEHARAMAEQEAALRDDAHRFGVDSGFKDAELSNQFANDELGRGLQLGGALGSFGEMERGLRQGQLDANRGAGQEATSWLANLYSGTQGNKGPTGSTQTNTQPAPSTFSQILGAGTAIGGMFMSDERAKEDIVPIGTAALDKLKLINPKEYKYKDGLGHTQERTTGIMAQELENAGIEGAVIDDAASGYKHVDPYPVMATVLQAVKELDARTG